MKKILACAAMLALAACGQAEKPAEDTAAATSEATSTIPTVANGSPPGTYEATAADGTVTTTVINADGTYTDTDSSGKVTAQGAWAVKDGKTCFTPTTEGVEAMCFTETAPAADGSFTATPDKGDPVTVRPAAAKPAETAPAQ